MVAKTRKAALELCSLDRDGSLKSTLRSVDFVTGDIGVAS